MPFFDLPLEQLERYRAADHEPADFDAFWEQTLETARAHELSPEFRPYETGLRGLQVFDVTFSGYGGQRIKGWYLRPAAVAEPLPCIVQYVAYGGGRGYPHNWLLWPAAGYATLVMDTRGQGSSWRHGDTPDFPDTMHGANPAFSGMMTQGITARERYYYRRVFVDAIRAVETACCRADVDPSRIAVTGRSQGGGLSMVAAALMPDDVALCLPEVPFLCHMRRAVGLTAANPYQEIAGYLKVHGATMDEVFATLDSFDALYFARRIRCPVLCSTALMDDICPPSTVFAAFNELTVSDKRMAVYHFNGHDGSEDDHTLLRLREVQRRFG